MAFGIRDGALVGARLPISLSEELRAGPRVLLHLHLFHQRFRVE